MHMTSTIPERAATCTSSDLSYGPDDLCDGTRTCPYGDDEFLCDDKGTCKTPDNGHCMNTTGTCFPLSSLCDGTAECADSTDQRFCDPGKCDDSCTSCWASGAVCDIGTRDNSLALQLPPIVRFLDLSYNRINRIESDSFAGLGNLLRLALSYNDIYTLPEKVFLHLTSLQNLDLSNNHLTAVQAHVYTALPRLQILTLKRNYIAAIEPGALNGLHELAELYLDFNIIEDVNRPMFSDLPNLVWLGLDSNNIEILRNGTFQDLISLTDLILRRNRISYIEAGAMRGLDKIIGVSFTGNAITELRRGMLDGLSAVAWISFQRNPLAFIEPGTFDNTPEITHLSLIETELDHLEPDMFRGITKLKRLSTDDYRLCCLFSNTTVCSAGSRSALDSCHRLMPNTVLRIAMWILGFSALIGNSMVLFIRCNNKQDKRLHEQPFFITNLAIADLMMGVFMIIVASADLYYGHYYYLRASAWRESGLCAFASLLAVLSSESSVFLLAIITFDRFVSVVFPFGRLRFHSSSARVCVIVTWIITLILSTVPIIVGFFLPNFYGLSDVCIGLPLSTDESQEGTLEWSHEQGLTIYVPSEGGTMQPAWIYSIVLFLGINLILFLFILVCYVIIFVNVRRSTEAIGASSHVSSSRDQEIKLAAKMAVIVGTDFCCWMPVIIMGILSQTGLVELPVALYAWCAVFILPINASLNPYLYTFVEYFGKNKSKTQQSSITTSSTIDHETRHYQSTKM
ncbi:uncharacterized protein [Diadema setosum]|uniref:uncharacterized protein n=1 Tax=Diadema setosum TaxID=31175 RepID=UPI003B3AF554